MEPISYREIDRIVYIWARYGGTRDSTEEGKHYSISDVKELIEKLNRFVKNPKSFNEGFEEEDSQ